MSAAYGAESFEYRKLLARIPTYHTIHKRHPTILEQSETLLFREDRILAYNGAMERPTTSTPEKLVRRDRSLFVSQAKTWSDHRAWISSLMLHTSLLVVLGLLWTPQTRGTLGEKDRPAGIALVHETTNGNEYFLSDASGTPTTTNTQSAAASSSQSEPNESEGPPISLEELLQDMQGSSDVSATNAAVNSNGGEGLSGEGGTTGTGQGVRGGANKAKTAFFGVEGTGASFVYVVDRSDSMNVYESGPLRAAKRELLKSLESLNDYHQFQIVFYNESIYPLSSSKGAGQMVFANDTDKQRAGSFIRAIPGSGGTEHLPALKLGLSFAPDVLFFLTDAEDPSLAPNQLAELQQRAERSLTTIHAIQFNVGPAVGDGGWIRELAEMNRGIYKYVDVTELQN